MVDIEVLLSLFMFRLSAASQCLLGVFDGLKSWEFILKSCSYEIWMGGWVTERSMAGDGWLDGWVLWLDGRMDDEMKSTSVV